MLLDRHVRFAIIGAAIAVRMAAVIVLQSHLIPRSTYEHGEIAENLVNGQGFSVKFLGADGPTSQQAPLYPFLLAGAYAMGGVGTPQSLFGFELVQSLLGGWLVVEVMAIATWVIPGRRWVPLLAGAIVALHPTLVYAATHVQVALLAAALLAATLSRAMRTATTGSVRDATATGLFLGLLILTDPILGLVCPATFLVIGMIRGPRAGFRLGTISLAVGVACVSPWIVRNALIHGELVVVKSTFGYAFWQGNCSLSEGTDKVVRASVERKLNADSGTMRSLNTHLWEARHEAGYLDDIALTKADYSLLAGVSEPERSRILFRRSLADLQADPWRYPNLCLRRLRYFFLFDETNPKTRNAIYRLSHVGLSVMAIVGLTLLPRESRKRMMPVLLTVALIALFHTLTIVSARFHIPIEPLLAVCAGGMVMRGRESTPAADNIVGVGIESGFRGRRELPMICRGVPQIHVLPRQQSTAQNA